jgi:HD-GYP domain-containing protein (c-di-GMP phosphodiesterase class II)
VADAYDAMTHDRPHRPALSTIAALQELRRCCPAGYDSDCVGALEEMMNARKLEEVFADKLVKRI